jgi:DNA recombination protein RmuC
MTTEFIILALLASVGFFVLWLRTSRQTPRGRENELLLLQNQLSQLAQTLDSRLSESTKAMRDQFGESSKIVRDVTEKLTRLDETNKQVLNFSDQLRDLQDILKNPKQRGILGEFYLETLLKNVLPPGSYQLQYTFPDNVIVDAVIFVKDKIIPIDSKFSLENYNRIVEERDENVRGELERQFRQDLKNRIDETAKYVKPDYGTMDFAFMFIPAEAIYYDLLVNKVGAVKVSTQDLIQYAFNEKHVIIVSPTSFLAYLQTVLQALRALQIEESAKEVRKNVRELERHLQNYQSYLDKLGTHLGTTVNMYNHAAGEFRKIDKDVMRLSGSEGVGYEKAQIDRPKTTEELNVD